MMSSNKSNFEQKLTLTCISHHKCDFYHVTNHHQLLGDPIPRLRSCTVLVDFRLPGSLCVESKKFLALTIVIQAEGWTKIIGANIFGAGEPAVFLEKKVLMYKDERTNNYDP